MSTDHKIGQATADAVNHQLLTSYISITASIAFSRGMDVESFARMSKEVFVSTSEALSKNIQICLTEYSNRISGETP